MMSILERLIYRPSGFSALFYLLFLAAWGYGLGKFIEGIVWVAEKSF